jgi:plastocyanin
MSIRACFVALSAAVAVAVGCQSRSSLPVSPSVSDAGHTISAPAVRPLASMTDHGKTITLFDACDPETFNDPVTGVGPGTCSRPGGVTFQNFVQLLTLHHSIGGWRFAPNEAILRVGDVLSAFNSGGEAHTFTEVEEFGGGNVQFLNDILGLTTVAPECARAHLLQPGQSSDEVEEEEGVEKYQCCIHPWMRAEVRIVEK